MLGNKTKQLRCVATKNKIFIVSYRLIRTEQSDDLPFMKIAAIAALTSVMAIFENLNATFAKIAKYFAVANKPKFLFVRAKLYWRVMSA